MPTISSHGATTRAAVYQGTRRVRGLWERRRRDGSVVYEARMRIGGADRLILLDASTKSDAIREHQALQVDRARGAAPQTGSLVPSVAALTEDYLAHLESRIGHRDASWRYSPATVDLYRQRLRDHVLPVLGHLRADQVTVHDLRRMVDRLARRGLAGSTIRGTVLVTSNVLRYAVKNRLVDRNVARDLDRDDLPSGKRQTEPRYLDAAQVERLLAALSDEFGPVVAVCAYAGPRVSEALGLTWADVDLDAATIRVERQLGSRQPTRRELKTEASAATLPVVPALVRELRAHRTRQAANDLRRGTRSRLVFTTRRGLPQHRRNVLRAVHRAGDKLGLNPPGAERVGVHDLRHTMFGLALASPGLSPADVAALARHASPAVTLAMYAGVSDTRRATLANRLADSGYGR